MKLNICAIALILAGCSGSQETKSVEPPAVPVHAASAEMRAVSFYCEAMGVIKASQMVEIKPQVSGRIIGVHFTEGAQVKQGDLLYTIDPVPYEIKVREMQAHLAQNLAHWTNAKKKWERYRSLSQQDLIAKVEWDELESKVSLFEALVKADRARLKGAQLDLEHCRIVAPIAGVTGKTALHAGNLVSGGSLVAVSQVDPLYVEFSITESEMADVRSSDLPIEVYLSGSDLCVATGKLKFIDPHLDPKTGMLSMRGEISQLKQKLRPGQTVRVHLIYGHREQSVMIPIKAIKTNQHGTYVYSIKDDQTVESRPVKLGREEKGMVVVEDGIDWGDKVVTEGHARLFPGSKVKELSQEVK